MKLSGYKRLVKLLPAVAFLLLFTLTACTGHEEEITPTGKGDALVTFSLRLPGESVPDTRALSEDGENAVTEIDVLVFGKNGGTYVYTAGCSGSQITGTGNAKTFTVTLRRGEYDLVVLAGARSIIEAATLEGKNKAAALAALTAAVPAEGKWPVDGSKPFPMWGDIGTKTINETTEIKNINLLRMVARVDVIVPTAVTNFKLSSVYVYNYNTQGTVVPTTAAGLTDGKVTYPVVPTSSTLTEGPLLYNGTAINTITNQCVREIYIMEAENHTDNHTKAKDLLKRTCLVVGGTYGSDSEPSYYRVDFSTGSGSAQTYLDVLRNHKYTINITKVSGSGYETPDIAFRSGPVNIEASVLTWNGVGMNILTTDGQYTLAVDQDEYTFNKEAVTSKDANNTLNVWTDYTTGWKVEKYVDATNESQTAGWLKLVPATGDKDNITETYIELEANETGASRSAKIYLEAGRIRKPITVTQGTASSVQPGIKLYLADTEISSGHQLTFTPKTGTSKDAKTLRVVWEPNSETVTVAVNKTCSNLEGQPISETFNGGSKQYTITTTAVTSNGNSTLPTDEESTVTFRTQSGHEATVKLLQKNYGLIYKDVKSKYASATSKEYSFTVKSNTNWKIGSVTDASNVLTAASKSALEAMTGTSGTTTVTFTVAANSTGAATLNFVNTDGLFADVAVTLNVQPVVPAEFGGSNIVWDGTKLTFSTGPDDTSVDAQAQGV
ncbi:BACON domain-containing protein, partial [Bacteroides sp. 51]|uniref:BACON domain-containing protein n=1 Tax=Bacteroides sp. 51 TaxID=2302938 RepID=UPI0013D4CA8A